MMAENPKQSATMPAPSGDRAFEGEAGRAGRLDSSAGSYQDAGQTIKNQARDMADQTKEHGKAILDQQRGAAAGQVDSVAHAFRTAAEQLRNEGQGSGNYVGLVADQLESAARQLREKNLDELMHGVQDMARRSPATFIAGSVAVGFLLSRFLKSSSQHTDHRDSYRQAYAGDDDYGDRSYDRRYATGDDAGFGASTSRWSGEEPSAYSAGGVGVASQGTPYSAASDPLNAVRNDTDMSTGAGRSTIANTNTPEINPGSDNLGGSSYGNR